MLHLGLGSFHRAHQAVYVHQLQLSGNHRWALAGGNIRPDMQDTIAALVASKGAYTLETVTPQGARSYTRIHAISRVIAWDAELSGLVALGAQDSTRIISFTVTEAGYYLDSKDCLDLGFADLQSDLDAARAGRPGSTIYGALVAILRARMRGGAGPLTLLNCDNLRHNGERARAGLLQFIDLLGDAPLRDWVAQHTSSPNAMVDRITPRPTAAVRERVAAVTGVDDPAALMGESFIQWVIEDKFIGGRPAWEQVGVEMVASVQAYEEAKIRLLNASHSCIAWAGTLVGYTYIHEGTHDTQIRQLAFDYVTDDVIPVLDTPEHSSPINLAQYRDVVLDRNRRYQPARGHGWLFQDPRLYRAHHPRAAGAGGEHCQCGYAARAVPGVLAALACRCHRLHLPGPGHGSGSGPRHLRQCRPHRGFLRRPDPVGPAGG